MRHTLVTANWFRVVSPTFLPSLQSGLRVGVQTCARVEGPAKQPCGSSAAPKIPEVHTFTEFALSSCGVVKPSARRTTALLKVPPHTHADYPISYVGTGHTADNRAIDPTKLASFEHLALTT